VKHQNWLVGTFNDLPSAKFVVCLALAICTLIWLIMIGVYLPVAIEPVGYTVLHILQSK